MTLRWVVLPRGARARSRYIEPTIFESGLHGGRECTIVGSIETQNSVCVAARVLDAF